MVCEKHCLEALKISHPELSTNSHAEFISASQAAPAFVSPEILTSVRMTGSVQSDEQSNLVTHARALLGTPYLHMGRSENGLDCAGLVYLAAKNAGVKSRQGLPLQDFPLPEYGAIPDPQTLLTFMQLHFTPVAKLAPGSIGVFAFDAHPRHLAIFTESNTIIHAYLAAGKVVEHRYNRFWQERLVGIWVSKTYKQNTKQPHQHKKRLQI